MSANHDSTSKAAPPVPLAPAPWSCIGEAFMISLDASKTVEPSAYAPLEASSAPIATNEAGALIGKGLGACVVVVRYAETPVGPYDEVLYIPGAFTPPAGGDGKPHLATTRIYVSESNTGTIYNGRVNWNIPKHPARFEFTDVSPSVTRVAVYPPQSSTPFFSASFSKIGGRYMPSIPFTSSFLPFDMTTVQPPVPASPTDATIAGTTTWRSVKSYFRGSVRLISVKPGGEIKDDEGMPQYADGAGFPNFNPYTIGLYWTKGTKMQFPVGTEFTGDSEAGDKKTV